MSRCEKIASMISTGMMSRAPRPYLGLDTSCLPLSKGQPDKSLSLKIVYSFAWSDLHHSSNASAGESEAAIEDKLERWVRISKGVLGGL